MCATVNHFHSSLIFSSKAGAYPDVTGLHYNTNLSIKLKNIKKYSKHTSLLHRGTKSKGKKFYNT